MDYRNNKNTDAWDDSVYGTGNTMPPKNYSGIIALLLILVIFLSGIVSFLGFLNIKLVLELSQQRKNSETMPISFMDDSGETTSPGPGNHGIIQYGESSLFYIGGQCTDNLLGIAGETLTSFDQQYYHVPAGLYLTGVEEYCQAWQQGIRPGDILLSINGTPITTQSALETFLGGCKPGDTVEALIYQDGQQVNLTITLTEN